MKIRQRALGLLLALALMLGVCTTALAADKPTIQRAMDRAAAYVYQNTPAPQVGSIGGEWAVLGLARSGYNVPEAYYADYYARVEAYVRACGGVLHEKKYTEYARVALAVTAIGKDPRNVAGYNLVAPLADYEKVIWQGVNGPIFALLALDAGAYAMPENPEAAVQATREMYVKDILSLQLEDGGWNLSGRGAADPDVTGMALQALAAYTTDAQVAAAVERALNTLSAQQQEDGGFSSWGTANAESVAQVLVALCSLGVDTADSRFVKSGGGLVEALLRYQKADGGFAHSASGGGSGQMAAEQGLYALAALLRALNGDSALYQMDDVRAGTGLPGRAPDVQVPPVTKAGTDFPDIVFSENAQAVRNMAARGIIDGMGNGYFVPEGTMTRAQFATIVVRGLGLKAQYRGSFRDVPENAWYAAYVDTACAYGLVNGLGNGRFNPEGTMTRQEAATLLARAAKLCGMDTERSQEESAASLARFTDSSGVADWAEASLAFCYENGILDSGMAKIEPGKTVQRQEIAQMLYDTLRAADLL